MASLAKLDDPIASKLFVAIINLIRHFCQEAVYQESPEKQKSIPSEFKRDGKFKINKCFERISRALNEDRREEALFNCLVIPDDCVRLAVVRCLHVVPLEEFDADEIQSIIRVLSGCTNIAAGDTELVLSTIFWICCNFVDINLDEEDSLKTKNIFETKFG